MQTLILAIVIIIVIILLSRRREDHVVVGPVETSPELSLLDQKLTRVIFECGYHVAYELYSHPSRSFTLNKSKMYICTSCAEDDRLLYMGLHEVAHLVTHSDHAGEDAHGPVWESTFRSLLSKAQELGYLVQGNLV